MEKIKHIQLPSDKKMSKVTPKDLIVYCALKQYENWETHDTFVGLDTISKKLNISIPTLRKSVKSLEEDGYLEIIKRKGQTSIYKFNTYKTFEGFSEEFLFNNELDINEKAYLAALQKHMFLEDGEVGKVSYNNKTISDKINMSERTIYRIEKQLQDGNYLTVVRNKSKDNETGCLTQTKIFDLKKYGQEIAFVLRNHQEQIEQNTDDIQVLQGQMKQVLQENRALREEINSLKSKTKSQIIID